MWKQPKCPATVNTNKMWYICTIEGYLGIKKEVWLYTMTWVKLENIYAK